MNYMTAIILFSLGFWVVSTLVKWALQIWIIWDEEVARLKWMKKHGINPRNVKF